MFPSLISIVEVGDVPLISIDAMSGAAEPIEDEVPICYLKGVGNGNAVILVRHASVSL